jgi:molybdopterin-guanine dinucleotide biosynthesis protein A
MEDNTNQPQTENGKQKTENKIFVLSQPIQTGKTTLLQQWIAGKQNIGGILTPDINGIRMLFDIANQIFHPLQLTDADNGIKIGRFVFSEEAFAKAQNILTNSLSRNFDWIIIDEIGRLEMDNNTGLEPAVSNILEYFKTHQTQTKLLLVIRDYLLEDAKRHYGLNDVELLTKDFFTGNEFDISTSLNDRTLSPKFEKSAYQDFLNLKSNISNLKLLGLVLCGGQSVRMGHDKAFMTYHQKPQYAHVAEMLKSVCDDVFISCNNSQQSKISQQYQIVLDNATFTNAGPMTGVLSAFEQYKNTALFVMGCDYPHFTQSDMMALTEAREDNIDVVCYQNPDSNFEEPLLAIYEKQCAPLLLEFYKNENTSLKQFLKTIHVKTILPENTLSITSVDF